LRYNPHMMRLAVAALVLTGLVSPVALATTPKWTAKGAITTLRLHSITVHGQTCRITTASPSRATLRLYSLGTEAKIACKNGVLHAIYPLLSPKPIVIGPPVLPAPSATAPRVTVVSSAGLITGSGSGGAPISELTDTSITAGFGRINLTCTIGSGSPNLGGFQVGDRVTAMNCKNGVLTSITRAA
jgi:hypothetical protein